MYPYCLNLYHLTSSMMSSSLGIRIKRNEEDGRSVALGLIEPRYNLATKVMSNGVEVIVATDRTVRPGEPEYLRLLSSTVTRPITLAPHTLINHMSMVLSSNNVNEDDSRLASSLNIRNSFITRTYYTTYACLSTIVRNGETNVSSMKTTVTNVRTEEALHPHSAGGDISPTPAREITVTESPSLLTEVHRSAYTYLNTIVDGEQPLVVTSRKTITNTVTALSDDLNQLEPSEVYPTTNTYLNTVEFTTTLTDGTDSQIVSTKDVLTQVVVTEPIQRETLVRPMTTEVTKTYFVTYTYFSTYIDGDETKVKSDVSVSSDVTIEKFYIKPKKTTLKYTESASVSQTPPLNIAVSKTYLTTFTYFTTMLLGLAGEKAETKVATRTRVMQNVVTETLSHKYFNEDYLQQLRNSLYMQANGSLITTATLKGGEKVEITAFEGGLIPVRVTPDRSATATPHIHLTEMMNEMHSSKTDDVRKTSASTASEYEAAATALVHDEASSNEITAEALIAGENEVTEETSHSVVTDVERIDVNPTKTTDLSNSVKQEGDEESKVKEEIAAADSVKRKPPKPQPSSDLPVNFLNLTSLGINGISVLKPVFNAMAELINHNINNKNSGSVGKVNGTVSPTKVQPGKKPITSNVNPLLNFVSGLKAPPKVEPKHRPTTPRTPVYIPVGSFAEDHEASESQSSVAIAPNLPPNWSDTQGKNLEKNRIDNGIAILEGGIPISPGQIITTNSDVIIGRPGSSGPRPPNFAVKDNFPIDMKPPPPPGLSHVILELQSDDVVGQHSTVKNVKPNHHSDAFKDHRQKHKPAQHDSGAADLNPPPVPPKILTVHRPITINHKPHEIIPYKPDHGGANIIPIPVHLETYPSVPQIQQEIPLLAEGHLNIVGQPTPVGHVVSQNGLLLPNAQNSFVLADDGNMSDRSTGHPLLVNIQPSQVANVVIPAGSSTAVIIKNENQHSLKGEVIDDPSPHPEPETVGFVGAEPVLRLENGEVTPSLQKIHQNPGDKRRPEGDRLHRHQGTAPAHNGGGKIYHHSNYHNFDQANKHKLSGLRYDDGNAGPGRFPPEYNHRVKDHNTRIPAYNQGHRYREDHMPLQGFHNDRAHPPKVSNGIYVDISPPGHLPPRSDFAQGNVVAGKPSPGVSNAFSNHQSGLVHDVPLNAQVQLGSSANKDQSVKEILINAGKYDKLKNKHQGQNEGQNFPKKPNGNYDEDLHLPPPPPPPAKPPNNQRPPWSYQQYHVQPQSPNNFMVPPPQVSHRPNYKPTPDPYPSPVMIPIGAGASEPVYPYPRPEDLLIIPHKQQAKDQREPGFGHDDTATGERNDPLRTEDGEELQESNPRPLLPGQIPTEIQISKMNKTTVPDRPVPVHHGYRPTDIGANIKYGIGRPHPVLNPSVGNRPVIHAHYNYNNKSSEGSGIGTGHGGQYAIGQFSNGDKIYGSKPNGNGVRVQRPTAPHDIPGGNKIRVEATVESVGLYDRPKIHHGTVVNASRGDSINFDKMKTRPGTFDDIRHQHRPPPPQTGRRPTKPFANNGISHQGSTTQDNWWITHGAREPQTTKAPDRPNVTEIRDSSASGTAFVSVTDDRHKANPNIFGPGDKTRSNATQGDKAGTSQKELSHLQNHRNHADVDLQRIPRPNPKPTQNVTSPVNQLHPSGQKTRSDTHGSAIRTNTSHKTHNIGNSSSTQSLVNRYSNREDAASNQNKKQTTEELPPNHKQYNDSVVQQTLNGEHVWNQPKPATEKAQQGVGSVEENRQGVSSHWPTAKPSRIPTDHRIKWNQQNVTNHQQTPTGSTWQQHEGEAYFNRTSPALVSEINGLIAPPKVAEEEVMGLSPPPPERPRRPQRPQRPKPPYLFDVPTTSRPPISIENDFPPVRSPDFNKKPIKPQDIFPPKLPENFIHHAPEYPVRIPKPRPPPGPVRPPVTSLPIDVPEQHKATESNEISKIYGHSNDINGHSKPLNEGERPSKRPKPPKTAAEEPAAMDKQTEPPALPVEKPVPPFNRLTERPVRPFDRPTERPVRPFDRPTERPARPYERLTERPLRPFDRPSERPVRPYDRPERPAQPIERITERPVQSYDRPAERPVRPYDRPAERPVQLDEKQSERPVQTRERQTERPVQQYERPVQPIDDLPESPPRPNGDVAPTTSRTVTTTRNGIKAEDDGNVIRGSETIYEPEEFNRYKTPVMKESTDRRKMVTTLITTGSTTIFADIQTPRPTETTRKFKTTANVDLDEKAVVAPTYTTTLTVTTTLTTVVHSVGQKPLTKTIVLTKTILSTVVDKITETQTLVRPTTATITQTHTIATTKTALVIPTDLHPTPTKKHSGVTLKPEIFVADPHSKDTMTISVSTSMSKEKKTDHAKIHNGRRPETSDESILVVMTNKHPSVNLTTEFGGKTEEEEEEEEEDAEGDVLYSGVFTPDSRPKYRTPTWRTECIPECKATRNERCQKLDGAMKCVCRPGFARMFPDRPCMPTYTYNMKLLLDTRGLENPNDLDHSESTNYLKLKTITKEGLDRMIMQSDLRDVFHGVSVNGFEPQEKNAMVDFYLQLSENTDESKLMDVFMKTLRNSNFSLGGTELYAARELATLEAEDFNECLHPKFHDCSENARCFNLKGTYTCSCKEGYTDLSENSLFPGRMCSDMIGCEYCGYHGTCYTRGDDQITCECFQWYSGERCRINLKVLLIALVTVGSILLALLLLCGILMCIRRRSRSSNASKTNGYLRYRGPPTQSLDKRAMIAADSSSESSVDNLPYISPPQPPAATGTLSAKRKPVLRHNPKGPAPRPKEATSVEQQDRSVTVMIPRAKYRPVPPMSPLMTMSTFSPDKHIRRSSAQISTEQKLISYLEGNAREGSKQSYGDGGTGQGNGEQKMKNYDTPRTAQPFKKEHRVFEYEYKTSNMQINDGTSSGERRSSKHGYSDRKFRRHSDSTHLNSDHPRNFQHRKYSAGALVSAGYEVSATVGLRHADFDTSEDEQSGILHTGTMKSNRSQFTTLNRTGDHKTMSEARSYDETTVHPATRTLKTNYSGSSPSSRINNDEGHTMGERDIGSTFILPESHLFKPEQDRGSDLSTFDSL